MKIERIEALYSQGTAEHGEDGFIVNPPFFGVVDGFSAPYHYKMEQTLFGDLTGGEMVRETILGEFYQGVSGVSLEEQILKANEMIGFVQGSRGIPLDRSDLLAAACFVFIEVGKEKVKIIQGGDCLAVWFYASGEIGATKNQVYHPVSENLGIIAKIFAELKEENPDASKEMSRKEMWVRFHPILSAQRLRDINNLRIGTGYAVLNGQPAVRKCWQQLEIPTKGLELMFLFSDGLVPYSETASPMGLAERLIVDYKRWGLKSILDEKRRTEDLHITHDEATAVAIIFET